MKEWFLKALGQPLIVLSHGIQTTQMTHALLDCTLYCVFTRFVCVKFPLFVLQTESRKHTWKASCCLPVQILVANWLQQNNSIYQALYNKP